MGKREDKRGIAWGGETSPRQSEGMQCKHCFFVVRHTGQSANCTSVSCYFLSFLLAAPSENEVHHSEVQNSASFKLVFRVLNELVCIKHLEQGLSHNKHCQSMSCSISTFNLGHEIVHRVLCHLCQIILSLGNTFNEDPLLLAQVCSPHPWPPYTLSLDDSQEVSLVLFCPPCVASSSFSQYLLALIKSLNSTSSRFT